MKEQELKKCFPEVPGEFSDRLDATLYSLPNRGRQTGKRILFRRVVPVLAAMLVLSTAAFAVGNVGSWTSHSSNKPSFTNLPTVQEVTKAVGYTAKVPSELLGGYKYLQATVGDETAQDESNNAVWKGKFLSVRYKSDKGALVLNVQDGKAPSDSTGSLLESYEGSDIYYYSYTSKTLPADYEMTPEDKADEASGKYVFAVGSPEKEPVIDEIQSVLWVQDSARYLILGINSPETQESLVAMAKAMIDSE